MWLVVIRYWNVHPLQILAGKLPLLGSTVRLLDLSMDLFSPSERYIIPPSHPTALFLFSLAKGKQMLLGKLIWQVTSKPIVIYPNSGETYDAQLKEWVVRFLP